MCRRGKECRFLHECDRCGSKDHGSMHSDCPGRRR
jgi:hypothetical protein